jgi:hypothetical protein
MTNDTDTDISTAVAAYIDDSRSAIPQSNADLLSAEMLDRVKAVISDYQSVDIDWEAIGSDFQRAKAEFRAAMAALRPELNDRALDALTWKFSWDWR